MIQQFINRLIKLKDDCTAITYGYHADVGYVLAVEEDKVDDEIIGYVIECGTFLGSRNNGIYYVFMDDMEDSLKWFGGEFHKQSK